MLRNYERWPEHFGKDVDLVVDANDMSLAERIIQRVADTFGLYVTVRRKRSSHVTYYLVGAPIENEEAGIILDLRPDVVHQGLVYLPGSVVLGSRQRHPVSNWHRRLIPACRPTTSISSSMARWKFASVTMITSIPVAR